MRRRFKHRLQRDASSRRRRKQAPAVTSTSSAVLLCVDDHSVRCPNQAVGFLAGKGPVPRRVRCQWSVTVADCRLLHLQQPESPGFGGGALDPADFSSASPHAAGERIAPTAPACEQEGLQPPCALCTARRLRHRCCPGLVQHAAHNFSQSVGVTGYGVAVTVNPKRLTNMHALLRSVLGTRQSVKLHSGGRDHMLLNHAEGSASS